MESRKKSFIGVVTSDKMDKTIVVTVSNRSLHPLYKKYVNSSKRTLGRNVCTVGNIYRTALQVVLADIVAQVVDGVLQAVCRRSPTAAVIAV